MSSRELSPSVNGAVRGEAEPSAALPIASEIAWLIEETWSGHVHYVHRTFNCAEWAAECRRDRARRSYGLSPLARIPIVTKNIDGAMRFPTKEAAELWLAFQPSWMSEGGQYQVREHMWPAERLPNPREDK